MTEGQFWLGFGLIGLCIVSVYVGLAMTINLVRDGIARYFRW